MAWRKEVAVAFAILTIASAASVLLRRSLAEANLAILYLLAVVAISVSSNRKISLASSIVSVGAFDFLCVPPYYTLAVANYESLVTLAGMLTVSLVIGTQTAKLRELALDATERAQRTDAVYRLSRTLAQETRAFDAARAAAALAEEVLHTRVVVLLPTQGRIDFARRTSDDLPLPAAEEVVAQRVFDSGEPTPAAALVGSRMTAVYFPLSGSGKPLGIMALLRNADNRLPSEETRRLGEVFAAQTALAMERIASQSAAEDARFRGRAEEMRSSLLSAVSHDLRTPLAAITGSASTLRTQGDRLAPETRAGLIEGISEEAERLARLVNNLLDMTRLESGTVTLRREMFPLEEVIGPVLRRLGSQLARRAVRVEISDDLPLLYGDDVLLGQLLWNLLENAAKYTPQDSGVEIAARRAESMILIEVSDCGPGIRLGEEQRIFEKFYRGERLQFSAHASGPQTSARGAGLGLPICRAIVEAHGGFIEARQREGGGAVFSIHLPIIDPSIVDPLP